MSKKSIGYCHNKRKDNRIARYRNVKTGELIDPEDLSKYNNDDYEIERPLGFDYWGYPEWEEDLYVDVNIRLSRDEARTLLGIFDKIKEAIKK